MTTKSISTFVFCPSCRVPGQLVLSKTSGWNRHIAYYYVNHFKDKKGKLKKRIESHFHARYAYCCYLGKVAVLDGVYNFFFPEPSAFAVAQRLVHFL